MKKKRIVWLVIFLHIIGIVFLKRVFLNKPPARQASFRKSAVEKITVKVEKVRREDLDFILSYAGSLKAKDEALVYPKISGKLSNYLVSEGDKIKKEKTIALIDRDETGLKYELAKVDSPLTGIIGRTFLDKGANVTSQITPIALVVDMDQMIVKLNIPEHDISHIKKGLSAYLKVDSYPNEDFEGVVSKISEVMDTQTRTLPIEILIPNPGHRLKSGMFSRIRIFAGKHIGSLVVLQDSLVKESSFDYVYIIEDSTARKVKVTAGIYQDNKVEILEGLKEGQRIIVFGHQGLKDGSFVNVIE
jgi:multidrug efflux pump subunit AcrA (membrane-fusion protein)